MKKSGLADSPFFTPPPSKNEAGQAAFSPTKEPLRDDLKDTPFASPSGQLPMSETERANKKSGKASPSLEQAQSEKVGTTASTMQASNNASTQASMQSLMQESIIEAIRKAVKDVGKDSATYRFTPEEKKALLELGFSYKMQGYKTSENELIRIALNSLLEDQKQNGRNSILQRVLDALNK